MWENDHVQFSRLLSELSAADAFDHSRLHLVCESMDINRVELESLLCRADDAWEEIKDSRLRRAPQPEETPQDLLFLYGKHVCNCKWEFISHGTMSELDQIMEDAGGEYLSYQWSAKELNL